MTHKTTHSVMFHHFHNEKHLPTQGSLSSSDFKQMIEWLRRHYSLLGASDYKRKFEEKSLKSSDICLSFDDALKCQYDVAIPILNLLGIDAFFFVYSSAFAENPDPLEVYRYFRTVAFSSIDDFYGEFFQAVEQQNMQKFSSHQLKYKNLNYLSAFPFYTENDKWFRYIRDQYLTGDQYHEIMHDLMSKKHFDRNIAKEHLWMSESELVDIESQGHLIGLHSYSHPTCMSSLTKSEQEIEYKKNYEHLTKLIGKPITAMSHPCGDYNENTLSVLSKMNIEIGFRSSMSVPDVRSSLEIPREDHANVFKEMNQ